MAAVSPMLSHLSDDEFEVECILRYLDAADSDAGAKLVKCLEKEQSDKTLMPKKSHVTEPAEELKACLEVANQLSRDMKEVTVDSSADIIEHRLFKTIHWSGRIGRLKASFGGGSGINEAIDKYRRPIKYFTQLLPDAIKAKIEKEALDAELESQALAERERIRQTTYPGNAPGAVRKTSSENTLNGNEFHHKATSNETQESNSEEDEFAFPDINLHGLADKLRNLRIAKNNGDKFNRNVDQHPRNNPAPERNRKNNRGDINPSPERPNHGYDFRHQPKWKLSFDGKLERTSAGDRSRSLDVVDFIFRLEMLAKRDNYPIVRLPLIISNFLTDSAEDWYWDYIRNNRDINWADMQEDMIARFTSHETEREIRRAIERRTQKPRESFNDFSIDLQMMNNRLRNRFPELELLEILRENMNPALQSATLTQRICSIEDLRVICQRYERLWNRSGHDPRFIPNSFGRRTQNVSQLDYQEDRYCEEKAVDYKEKQHDTVEAVNQDSVPFIASALAARPVAPKYPDPTLKLICYNCSDIGHTFHDCLADWTEFCTGCGKKGIRRPNCISCQKWKLNYRPSGQRQGEIRSGSNFPRTSTPNTSESTDWRASAQPRI